MTTHPPILNHLAIIPDGNRRWAAQNAILSQKKIYEQGSAKTFEILEAALQQNIPRVTFWASSYANLAERAKGFVDALEDEYQRKFYELAKHPLIHKNKVRIEIRGEWRDLLKPETCDAIQAAIDATIHYDRSQILTILIGYDGHRERGVATIALLKDSLAGFISLPTDLLTAEELFQSYAWTSYLPKVDLLIRTGASEDPHNSAAFLSLLTGESQYAFPKVLWPDFTVASFSAIVDDFLQRERRLGR